MAKFSFYKFGNAKWNTSPATAPIRYRLINIIIFRLIFFPLRNKIASPTPALATSPPSIEPKEIIPSTYAAVSTADDAQLGISPTRAVKKGSKYLLLAK